MTRAKRLKEREQPEVKWTVPIEKFISLLIQHISPKHFRVVRYYGALATKTKLLFKEILSKLFRRMMQISKLAHLERTFNLFHREGSSSLSFMSARNEVN